MRKTTSKSSAGSVKSSIGEVSVCGSACDSQLGGKGSQLWFQKPCTPPLPCPSPQGGTHHKVSRMWEVIENSTRGADGSMCCGSICSTKWCKHNTQGVRDTILPCDDSMRGCRGDPSWTNCEIVHVSRSFGQGDRGWEGLEGRGKKGPVTGVDGSFWAGAVVSLPTELHSGVSRCCLLTKMAPNASPCEIPC